VLFFVFKKKYINNINYKKSDPDCVLQCTPILNREREKIEERTRNVENIARSEDGFLAVGSGEEREAREVGAVVVHLGSVVVGVEVRIEIEQCPVFWRIQGPFLMPWSVVSIIPYYYYYLWTLVCISGRPYRRPERLDCRTGQSGTAI
jgi:hypothetical protein